MDIKRILRLSCFLAAMLFCGCRKEDPTPVVPPVPAPPTPYDRTGEQDLLSRTIDVETFVIDGEHPEGSYAGCVFNRLTKRASAFNDNTTRAVIIFDNSAVTPDDGLDIFRCLNSGGVVVIVNPDAATYDLFRENVARAAKILLIDRYNTAGIDEDKWVETCKGMLFNCASMRYEGSGNPYECLAFCRKDRYLCPKFHSTAGAAQYGLAADVLARWISDELDGKGKETPSEETELPCISSGEYLHSATISCSSAKIFGGRPTASYADVVNICVKWSLTHAPTYNRDYYFVDEGVTVHTSNVQPVPDAANNRLWHYNEPQYEVAYLDGFEDRIEMSMRGNNGELVAAPETFTPLQYHPHRKNETYAPDVVTDPPMHQPVYIPGQFGAVRPCFAGEFKDFKEAFAGSLKQNETGFDCIAGQQCNISNIDLNSEVRYNFVNYRYSGREPEVTFKEDAPEGERFGWEIPSNLLSDCTQHNVFYTRPQDIPSGSPMLHLTGYWKIRSITAIPKIPYWQSYDSDVYIGEHEDFIDLGKPYRHIEKWTLECSGHGDLTYDSEITAFDEAYAKDLCPEGLGRTNVIGGFDEADSYEANLVFDQFMADFENKSKDYAEQGFTGLFTFTFKSEQTERILTKSFRIKK